jgi:DNA invertase Pin-like site-specific DNA recombinase
MEARTRDVQALREVISGAEQSGVEAMKAFAYLRVSGKSQVDGDGFPRQLEAVQRYAAAHGIRIGEIYQERAVPGATELENRPALAKMVEDLRQGTVRLVLIEKLDRLARDLMVQESIIADLRRIDVELVSVAEPDLCQNDPSRVLMRQIFGAFAQYEKAMIVAKLRVARERVKARTGRCEGAKPYGFRPGESEIAQRIRAMHAAKVPYLRIAEQLNAEGVAARRGRWHPYSVSRVVEAGR